MKRRSPPPRCRLASWESPTPAGLFATNWKAKLRRRSDNAEWLLPWYVNLINATGVSFHQFALPGYPASHACVRLFDDDARWIVDWTDSWVLDPPGRTVLVHGTPVLVFGDFAYDQPGPWTRLAEDASAATVSAGELPAALEPHRATIGTRAALRAAWQAARPSSGLWPCRQVRTRRDRVRVVVVMAEVCQPPKPRVPT